MRHEEEHPWSLAFALMVQGDIAREQGDTLVALAAQQQALSVAMAYEDRVRVGDTISIRLPRRQITFRVRSIPPHAPGKEGAREMIELLGSNVDAT